MWGISTRDGADCVPNGRVGVIGMCSGGRHTFLAACMKIDTLEEPPMFQVTETHFAKTWLLDPRSPKVEKPEGIQDIHGKLMKAFNI